MSKQTAVQELITEMESLIDKPYINPKNALTDCINLAYSKLQMEREQMDKVAGDFWNEGASYVSDGKSKYNSFEQYYKETYGGQDEK